MVRIVRADIFPECSNFVIRKVEVPPNEKIGGREFVLILVGRRVCFSTRESVDQLIRTGSNVVCQCACVLRTLLHFRVFLSTPLQNFFSRFDVDSVLSLTPAELSVFDEHSVLCAHGDSRISALTQVDRMQRSHTFMVAELFA